MDNTDAVSIRHNTQNEDKQKKTQNQKKMKKKR
jgi:hypothetical protein